MKNLQQHHKRSVSQLSPTDGVQQGSFVLGSYEAMNSDVDIKPASTASTRDLALASVKSDVRRLRAELGVAKQVSAAPRALIRAAQPE
jgi:hypothetical protein